jgi:hypothetical protein
MQDRRKGGDTHQGPRQHDAEVQEIPHQMMAMPKTTTTSLLLSSCALWMARIRGEERHRTSSSGTWNFYAFFSVPTKPENNGELGPIIICQRKSFEWQRVLHSLSSAYLPRRQPALQHRVKQREDALPRKARRIVAVLEWPSLGEGRVKTPEEELRGRDGVRKISSCSSSED